MTNRQLMLAVASLLTFASHQTLAASSGTLNLSGTVAVVSELSVTANGANNSSLDIINGESNKLVGSATETSNNLSGYSIKLSSTNGGELRNTSDSNKKTTYRVSYDGDTATTPSTTPTTVKTVNALSALTSAVSEIRVDVDAASTAAAGTYTDTLTLSIESN